MNFSLLTEFVPAGINSPDAIPTPSRGKLLGSLKEVKKINEYYGFFEQGSY